MTNFTAALQRQVARAGNDFGTLTWTQVEDVLGWAGDVEGNLRARLLISQIASDLTDTLPELCAMAILATDIPVDLVAEVVSLVPPCRASMEVVSRVLAVVQPDHLLANVDLTGTRPFALYDAIDDGTVIRVSSIRGERPMHMHAEGLLLGVEAPVEQVVRFRVVRVGDDGADLTIAGDAEWLERTRVSCPPMIVVA